MIANHIHQALSQVRDLQKRVLESQRFRGYSGRARAASGTIALLAAAILSMDAVPPFDGAHLAVWAAVLVLSVSVNYGALLCWFLSEPRDRRDRRQLLPALDSVYPLLVGAILTAAILVHGLHALLFGTWMCLFGLANLSPRRVLPGAIVPLGLYYIAAGAVCLLVPGLSFTDPWPMGLVFFAGEWAGGIILFLDRRPGATLWNFLGFQDKNSGGRS